MKHLAPYLPYGLRIKTKHGWDTMSTLNEHEINGDFEESYPYENHSNVNIEFSPILRPLSDFLDINCKANNDLNLDISMLIELNEVANKQRGYLNASYGTIQMMCENHIDFQDLIELGLAVDINSLKSE